MIKKILCILFTILFFHSVIFAHNIDIVHLKDGTIVKGIIEELVINKFIKIRTTDGSLNAYKFENINKIVKKEVKDEPVKINTKPSKGVTPQQIMKYIDKEKNGGAAFLWSFFALPGAGHWYCGEVGNGFLFLLFDAACIIGMIELGYTTMIDSYSSSSYSSGYYYSSSSYPYTYTKTNDIFYVFLGALVISRIFEWANCFSAATRYNKKLWQKIGMPEGVTLSLNFKPNNKINNNMTSYAGLNCNF